MASSVREAIDDLADQLRDDLSHHLKDRLQFVAKSGEDHTLSTTRGMSASINTHTGLLGLLPATMSASLVSAGRPPPFGACSSMLRGGDLTPLGDGQWAAGHRGGCSCPLVTPSAAHRRFGGGRGGLSLLISTCSSLIDWECQSQLWPTRSRTSRGRRSRSLP